MKRRSTYRPAKTSSKATEARDAYPTEVAAALQYAAENKYDYGPKLRDADLQWGRDTA